MRIVSWNVNGLRAVAKKGFTDWLKAEKADIVGLQETRVPVDAVPGELSKLEGFHTHFVAAERAGYSGVGLYTRRPFDSVETTLGMKKFDEEGRYQIARFGRLIVVNAYFPNGSGQERDNSRVPYKLAFKKRIHKLLEDEKKKGTPIIVMGDWNTAPREIDIARPKENAKTSGFLPEEREEMERWYKTGWVDSFRHFHPEAKDRYSWWSQRFGVREKNVGWRIDLALVSPGAIPYLRHADIHHDVKGSDHCPISIELDDSVIG